MTKTCTVCGGTKPLDEFYRSKTGKYGRSSRCRVCLLADQRVFQARKRADVGEDAWREIKRSQVQRHRARTGNRRGKAYARARSKALTALRERHPDEFDALLATELALEGILYEGA